MVPLTFYFDRCFGKRFPEALKRTNPPFAVEWQNRVKLFKQNATDDDWLAHAGAHGWIVFSHDRKFHSVAVEAEAVKQHKVACFYLCGANSKSWDKLCYFVKAYPAIQEIVTTNHRPYIFHLRANNRIYPVTLP